MRENLVIVVDMINGFVNEGALGDIRIRQIIPNIQSILNKMKKEDIWFVVDQHKENAKEFEAFPVHCLINSSESQIIEELLPYVLEENKIAKNSTNAFYRLDLNRLKEYSKITLVGCCTDICVLQLALSLKTYFNEFELDIDLFVIDDACSTFSAPHHHGVEYHTLGLSLMKQAGITVIHTGEF